MQETAKQAAEQGKSKWEAALPALKAKAADLQKALPKPGQGGVTYRANVKQEALSTLQRDQIGLLEKIAKPLGYNFVMMEFDKDAQGNYVTDKGQIAPNGFFRDSDGTIYIDVNAGKTAGRMVDDTIIPLTAGHELGHYLKATSPELFRDYSAAVVDELVSKGADIDALIAKQIGRGKLREITVESAIEEMIMESGAMILSNSQAAQKMAETNPGLFQKIAEWVKDFVDSIRKAFSRVDATPEAKAIMQTVNGALKYSDTIINLWDTMAVTEAQGRADVKPATVARRDVQSNSPKPDANTEQKITESLNIALADKDANQGLFIKALESSLPNEYNKLKNYYITSGVGERDVKIKGGGSNSTPYIGYQVARDKLIVFPNVAKPPVESRLDQVFEGLESGVITRVGKPAVFVLNG
ncbi:MAG: hypothetical protein EOM66_11025, partial [Clostridia bacterium]|nr:hypothetical protein [Clostridia bacterium]